MFIGSTDASHLIWEINKPVTNLFDPNDSVLPDWLRTNTIPTDFPVTSPEFSSVTDTEEIEQDHS